MGRRRKRLNSDLDDSLEERYSQYTYHGEASDAGNHASSQGEMKPIVVKKSEVSKSSIAPSKKSRLSLIETNPSSSEIGVVCDKDKQRIERLRQQKKRRKERKKAKDLAKKETMEKQSDAKKSSKESDQCSLLIKKKKDNPNKEFKIMAKGVQYRDVSIGKGPVVKERKKIRVSYVLRSQHRYGKILDSSNDFRFRLGRGEVIKGWDLGVLGMRQGGTRHLIVPPNAGYGGRDVGAGKGGLLFFEITVLDC